MSLLIDDGLVLSNTTTTDRNLIESSGNDLVITTNNGDILMQSTTGFTFGKNCDLVNGSIHNTGEYRGTSTSNTNISAQTGYNINLKTNGTNRVDIDNTKITFTKNPQLLTATSATANGQLMPMNNFMTNASYDPKVTTASGDAGMNLSSTYGRYCKIGNLVYITINVVLNAKGTLVDTESIRISLPINTTTGAVQNLSVSKLTNLDMTTVTSVFDAYAYLAASSSYAIIYYKKLATDTTVFALQGNQMTNTTQIAIGGFYFT